MESSRSAAKDNPLVKDSAFAKENSLAKDNSPIKSPLTMQELFMKYPIGTTITNQEIQGYRHTQTQSALLLADGSWKSL